MSRFCAFLILLLGAPWLHAEPSILDSRTFHKSDSAFFFNSISYEHGRWRFELSRNSMGMLWRTIDGKEDVTGVCNYRQTLVIPKSSSLEIKNQDISIFFRPEDPPEGPGGEGTLQFQAGYAVWKRFGSGSHSVGHNELQTAWMTAHEDGRVEISSWDDQ